LWAALAARVEKLGESRKERVQRGNYDFGGLASELATASFAGAFTAAAADPSSTLGRAIVGSLATPPRRRLVTYSGA
jgi:hypothetical protein